MWFIRVSTDTAMSAVRSGSTIWAWVKVFSRADVSYQIPDGFNDDVFIFIAYFVVTFCAFQYALARRHGTSTLPLL
jgi:hypothetical protein